MLMLCQHADYNSLGKKSARWSPTLGEHSEDGEFMEETLVLGLRRWRPLFLVVVDHGPEVAEPHIGAGPIGWKQRKTKLAQKA